MIILLLTSLVYDNNIYVQSVRNNKVPVDKGDDCSPNAYRACNTGRATSAQLTESVGSVGL